MSHSVIFHSDDLQARADSRWDIPLAYSQAEMDAWNPGSGKFKRDLVDHLVEVMDEEIAAGESLVDRGQAGEWSDDLNKAESWAANAASHLARAYVIARSLEKRGSADAARKGVLAQRKINGLHDDSEWLIAQIEGAR